MGHSCNVTAQLSHVACPEYLKYRTGRPRYWKKTNLGSLSGPFLKFPLVSNVHVNGNVKRHHILPRLWEGQEGHKDYKWETHGGEVQPQKSALKHYQPLSSTLMHYQAGERVPLDDRAGGERELEPDVRRGSCFRSVPSHSCSLLFWVGSIAVDGFAAFYKGEW